MVLSPYSNERAKPGRFSLKEKVLHFKQPAGTSRGVYTTRKSWFVHLYEGGREGVGECAPLPDLSCDAMGDDQYASILNKYCEKLCETGEIDYDALRDYPSMLFGLETAVLSLRSSFLYDTAFSRGEVGIPINGLVWMGSYEEMLQRMEQKLEQGFRCVKLKIGAIDFEQELDLIRRIRDRFSFHEVELRLDANGAFAFLPSTPNTEVPPSVDDTPPMNTPPSVDDGSPAIASRDDALYKLELLSQYNIHSIEQPIRQGQWAFMAELCRESPLPIALDEELIGVNDSEMKHHMLSVIKPAYIVLKPSLHGGMAGCREWISTAQDLGIGSWITSALESNIGLNAIAQFCSAVYGDSITFPQGLGTGQLFTDNIPMPLEIRGDRLWRMRE